MDGEVHAGGTGPKSVKYNYGACKLVERTTMPYVPLGVSGAGAAMDLKGGAIGNWLVIGWFTPDYRPLAERFAANLAQLNVAFHLWAKPKIGEGWSSLRKPSIVLEAMDAYPRKTLILMDTDCIVNGDISPVTAFAGDISLTLKTRR